MVEEGHIIEDTNALPVPEGIAVVKEHPYPELKRGRRTEKIDWQKIKQDYLDNPEVTIADLCQRHSIGWGTMNKKAGEEGWAKLRRVVKTEMVQKLHLEQQQQTNTRHILIAKLLQKEAVEAIKKKQVRIRSAKTALDFITESVRIEREALGMTEQKPQIVNIVAQQQGIIDKYKK